MTYQDGIDGARAGKAAAGEDDEWQRNRLSPEVHDPRDLRATCGIERGPQLWASSTQCSSVKARTLTGRKTRR